ncbi:MAG: hypothetical protein AAFV78_03110 [Bacteroidota bacterium]
MRHTFLLSFLFFILLSLIGMGCSSPSDQTSSKTTTPEEAATTQPNMEVAADSDGVQTRGLPPAEARLAPQMCDRFPLVCEAIKDDPKLLEELKGYVGSLSEKEKIQEDQDILDILAYRDQKLADRLLPYIENLPDGYIDAKAPEFMRELNQLGFQMNFAEGQFVGLSPFPILEDEAASVGSQALKLKIQFEGAKGEAQNGEYPYLNMTPYIQMVQIGEEARQIKPNPYWDEMEKDFERALTNLTDIHLVHQPTNRQAQEWIIGGTNREAYPYATETEGRKTFAQSASSYSQVVARIMENPSEISSEPENIYVIVTEWKDAQDLAQQRVIYHLNRGVDIPHTLKIRRGDGTDRYAVAYRFYESEDLAEQAFEKIEDKFPDARLILCSVRGEDLYQLGPSED